MKIAIRPVPISEVDALQRIAYETFDDAFRSMNTEETMARYLREAFGREKLAAELANPESRFFFICADEVPAGYLKLNDTAAQTDLHDPTSIEVERIYVKKAFQGKGLGRRLIEHAVQAARGLGKEYIWLSVWEKSAEAIAFYRKVGFHGDGRREFRMGNEVQHDFIMKRALGA